MLGREHADTLVSMSNLAHLLTAQGKLDEAEPLLRAEVDACRRSGEYSHSRAELAQVLCSRGDLLGAEPLVREELQASRQLLGPSHPDTLVALRNLSKLMQRLVSEKPEAQAEALTLASLDVQLCRDVFGSGHARTLEGMEMLASLHQLGGRYREAVRLLHEVGRLRLEGQGSALETERHLEPTPAV